MLNFDTRVMRILPSLDAMDKRQNSPIFLEFFAGGGMARAGLGSFWRCIFANEIDEQKAECYRTNWEADGLVVDDVANLKPTQIPRETDLAWASFPCQDLSLAGDYHGLAGQRSGTFWPFWKLMRALIGGMSGPRIIALENVCGALTSHSGRDFAAIASAFSGSAYRFGAMTIDARFWVPQSRPRLFVIGIRGDLSVPKEVQGQPSDEWHSRALRAAQALISRTARSRWIWWNLPLPQQRTATFTEIIEEIPQGTIWNTPRETDYVVSLMAPLHRKKLDLAIKLTKKSEARVVGCVYRRTREGQQRAEVRFDKIAGCLRTPAAGPRVRPSSWSSAERS